MEGGSGKTRWCDDMASLQNSLGSILFPIDVKCFMMLKWVFHS